MNNCMVMVSLKPSSKNVTFITPVSGVQALRWAKKPCSKNVLSFKKKSFFQLFQLMLKNKLKAWI